jgi:hypothetical protein
MIKATTDAQVRTLVAALAGPDGPRREAAAARLIILGRRAVARLTAAYEAADRPTRVAILRILGESGDDRALGVARDALGRGGEVAVGGVGVLRELLSRSAGTTPARALECLLAVSSDPAAERRVRAAAAEALAEASPDISRAVSSTLGETPRPVDVVWEDAAEGRLPEDPGVLREAIAGHAASAPLTVLHRMIEAVAAMERAGQLAPRATQEWRAIRGALHQVLAERGSRVGVYDLRETIADAAGPLPASFLAAVNRVGDVSCLEPLAIAFERARTTDPAWAQEVAAAFHAVARREHVSGRHAAMRKARARCPAISGSDPGGLTLV